MNKFLRRRSSTMANPAQPDHERRRRFAARRTATIPWVQRLSCFSFFISCLYCLKIVLCQFIFAEQQRHNHKSLDNKQRPPHMASQRRRSPVWSLVGPYALKLCVSSKHIILAYTGRLATKLDSSVLLWLACVELNLASLVVSRPVYVKIMFARVSS